MKINIGEEKIEFEWKHVIVMVIMCLIVVALMVAYASWFDGMIENYGGK